jgi:hypothetical protein
MERDPGSGNGVDILTIPNLLAVPQIKWGLEKERGKKEEENDQNVRR